MASKLVNYLFTSSLRDCITGMLKVSYDVAKKNIILCIWCNSMFKIKKNIIFHILYIIIDPLCSAFLKRLNFDKAQLFLEARCALIGQLSSALWLAEYN